MNDNGVVTNYTPNGLNQYTAVTGQAPVYDGDFHLYSYDSWTYTHDADGRLTSATAAGHSAQFVYDGLGRCVKRTIDGVVTLLTYDGWKPIAEWDGVGTFVAYNIYGPGADEILERYQAGIGYTHYHADRQGNVTFLLNVDGYGLERYSYDAFGQPRITDWAGNLRTTSAYGNRFMFTGREYLSTLGLYDYRHRMYHPGLGRFLEVDPTGFGAGDANLYRYVGNNPVNRSDPSGLGWWEVVKHFLEYAGIGQMERVTVTRSPIGDPFHFDPGWESYSSEGALGVFTQGNGQGSFSGTYYARTYQPFGFAPKGGYSLSEPAVQSRTPATMKEFIAMTQAIEGGNPMDTKPTIDPIDVVSFGLAGMLRDAGEAIAEAAVEDAAANEAGTAISRSLSDRIGDFRQNPENWQRTWSSAEQSTSVEGGISVESSYRNTITGETLNVHDVYTPSGSQILNHPTFRDYGKGGP